MSEQQDNPNRTCVVTAEFVDELPAVVNPNRNRSGGKPRKVFVDFAEALRENPGKWAKWPTPLAKSGLGTAAYGVNHRAKLAPVALRTGEFEAAQRSGVVYVRYVGDAS